MGLKDWVSLIISLLSAGIALAALWVSLHVAKTNLRTNLRVVWTRDLIGWGNACVRMFTEARLLANLRTPTQTEEEFEKTRRRLLCELSAQIDQGRLFFENELKDRHGTDKEPAYRGFTPRIIQVLKVPYRELTKIKFNS